MCTPWWNQEFRHDYYNPNPQVGQVLKYNVRARRNTEVMKIYLCSLSGCLIGSLSKIFQFHTARLDLDALMLGLILILVADIWMHTSSLLGICPHSNKHHQFLGETHWSHIHITRAIPLFVNVICPCNYFGRDQYDSKSFHVFYQGLKPRGQYRIQMNFYLFSHGNKIIT